MSDRSDWTVRRIRLEDEGRDSGVAHLSPAERLAMVWSLTVTAYQLAGRDVGEPGLHRHVVRIERGRG